MKVGNLVRPLSLKAQLEGKTFLALRERIKEKLQKLKEEKEVPNTKVDLLV